MNETVLMTIIGVETAVLICLALVMRLVTWPLYVAAREEAADLKVKLEATTQGKEGWRAVAERTLVVAQLSRDVGKRATTLVAKVSKLDEAD